MTAQPQRPVNSPPLFVVLQQARNHLEAELLVSVLKAAGIPAYVPGGMLTDEFAVSQRLLNLNSVDVLVPEHQAEAARAAIAEAKASAKQLEAEAPADEPAAATAVNSSGARYPWLLVGALGIAAVAFLVLWQEERVKVRRLAGPLLEYGGEQAGTNQWNWVGTQIPAQRATDLDQDGIAEQITTFNRTGRPLQTLLDTNENGVYEQASSFGTEGAVRFVTIDEDEDGIPDRLEEQLGDRTLVTLFDRTDGKSTRIELRDAKGKVLHAWLVDASDGLKAAQ